MVWHRPGDKPFSWGQAMTKTNDDLLLIGDFGTNLSETENAM